MTQQALSDEQLERTEWDAVVVGTGMGGATLGYALARAGRRVLFLERGYSHLAGDTGRAILGHYPEQTLDISRSPSSAHLEALARGGRSRDLVEDVSRGRPRSFTPFIGSGTGGSSALYGMVCERLFPSDFSPRANHGGATESSVPETWPISYGELLPHYEAAEKLFQVHGGFDPIRGADQVRELPAPPPFTPPVAALAQALRGRGLHPYQLPMACSYIPECATCQSVLCPQACKADAGRMCVSPAITDYGAQLLSECTVLQLDADPTHVRHVICERRGRTLRLRGKMVVLAAGALFTPLLLLRSKSAAWSNGLANRSGQVGRNLMRHLIELIKLPSELETRGQHKELGFNDFYTHAGEKFGTVQSFGLLPPLDYVTNRPGLSGRLLNAANPLLKPLWKRVVEPGLILAAIMEDLPHAENRVEPSDSAGSDGRQGCRLTYRVRDYDAKRFKHFVREVEGVLKPLRPRTLSGAMATNEAIAHACGTCRFGSDPETSVLDASNRAHDVDNLYVVDSSFFPSSGGVNPSLTIAANALRVAALMNTRC
jgi:choline dehydrogenase-like flavoprotein